MLRHLFALSLLVASGPAAAASAPFRGDEPSAAPERVVEAFDELCLRSPHAWSAVRSLQARGAVLTAGASPTADAPLDARFSFDLDGATAHVEISGSVCALVIAPVDVDAAVARLDTQLAETFDHFWDYAPAQDQASPGDGKKLRDERFTYGENSYGTRIVAIETGVQRLALSRRFETVATGEPEVVEFAPSEDLAGRAVAPPRYPGSARRACAGGLARTRVTVDAQGAVLDVVVERSAGRRDLDAAAREAARQWRYFPGIRAGRLVGGDILVPINFTSPCGR